ncbi:MAG: SynChlorMet cassette radical SAM/SPASM protein ScmF [Verrucomicrobiae bacterium]|nr:SynChlorMet cassette radical SAM/SPASM protein ScmF [Verrucomicrobiae bacterium]
MSQPETTSSRYPLQRLYFYLTEGCNLACRHCWIAPKYQADGKTYPALEFELFCDIVEQAKPLGLHAVKLTGGEPLLHPQIDKILQFVAPTELRLIIETNGMLCTPVMAAQIRRSPHAFVAVSLDGADAATHDWMRGVDGSFERAVTGIRNLVAAGLRPQVIMTVMRRNCRQVAEVVRLAESWGAGSVKFNLVQPTARGEQMHKAGETLSIAELVELGRYVETDLSAKAGIPLYFDHPMAFRPLSRMFFSRKPYTWSTCGILGILGVLADGSYALCGIGETVPELVFGHASKDRLEHVWLNNAVLNEIREGLPSRLEGVCRRCVHRNVCLGSCVAQNYYSSGNLFAAYWFCALAEGHGLFPASRLFPENCGAVERLKGATT